MAGGVFTIPVVGKETGGCAYSELERAFVHALTLRAVAYRQEGTWLFLVDEVGEEALVFTDDRNTAPRPPLPPMATEQTEDGTFFTSALDAWDPGQRTTISGMFDPGTCLRLDRDGQKSPYLIWPPGMALTEVDDQPAITSAGGDLLVRPGDLLELEGVYLHPPADWGRLIPEACAGPYFAISPGEGAITILDSVTSHGLVNGELRLSTSEQSELLTFEKP